MDCFGDVLGLDLASAIEVGDSAGNLESAVASPGAEAFLLHGALEKPLAVARLCVEIGARSAEGAKEHGRREYKPEPHERVHRFIPYNAQAR